jgi:hypothetical protein
MWKESDLEVQHLMEIVLFISRFMAAGTIAGLLFVFGGTVGKIFALAVAAFYVWHLVKFPPKI